MEPSWLFYCLFLCSRRTWKIQTNVSVKNTETPIIGSVHGGGVTCGRPPPPSEPLWPSEWPSSTQRWWSVGGFSWRSEAPPPTKPREKLCKCAALKTVRSRGLPGIYPQQLRGEDSHGGGPVADLVVLDFGHVCGQKRRSGETLTDWRVCLETPSFQVE